MTADLYTTVDGALDGISDGASIMFGGFVSAGSPGNLILGLKRRGTRHLTAIANNIGLGDKLDELCEDHQIDHVVATFAIRASGGGGSRFGGQYRGGGVWLYTGSSGAAAGP